MTYPSPTLPRHRVLTLAVVALAAGGLILAGVVLPAEFDRDPLGFGQWSGLSRLSAKPAASVANNAAQAGQANEYATPFRSDTLSIPLAAGGDNAHRDELEYKVHLKKGADLIYSWQVVGLDNAEEFYYDFHGHVPAPATTSSKNLVVATYRQATGLQANGSLRAPFDGIHGWFLQNQSDHPITVKLRISGFYDLIPAGKPGNEAGLQSTPAP
ncbi:hypothetical protein VVD49_10455 [Uliginosibacterium sp. H3]|uniref:Uncharacterized protein n=1 Tax=Uliginosibacterium silvisoli TaxID=3114758 RepID=A0ABU6K3E0_9RHOO|nr:hypothetical protein [Uliginosibacterium sp. H3]